VYVCVVVKERDDVREDVCVYGCVYSYGCVVCVCEGNGECERVYICVCVSLSVLVCVCARMCACLCIGVCNSAQSDKCGVGRERVMSHLRFDLLQKRHECIMSHI